MTTLVAGGDGLARHEGLAVFVPRTAVGDRVRARVTSRGRFARATGATVLTPSPDRVVPPCVHYERDGCGGCQWQHVSLDAQRRAKGRIVADAFERIARQPIPLPTVIGDGHAFGYRRSVRFTVRGRGAARTAGFHAADDPDRVVDVATCLLAEPALQAAWAAVREALSRLPVAASRGAAAEGEARARGGRGRGARPPADDVQVTLRRLDDGRVALAIEGGTQWRDVDIAALARAVPGCRGIWWTPKQGVRRLVWDAESPVPLAPTLEEADALTAAASFVQVNAGMADTLHAHVLAQVQAAAPTHVCDAYAGAGRLALALERAGVPVTAIERDAHAAAHATARFGARARMVTGAVEAVLGEVLDASVVPEAPPVDVVVLNPPRGGCDAAVTARLARPADAPAAAPHVRAIVYVSCDPATLARDVQRLVGWRVQAVTCFDLFPQTSHVESVCVLRPEAV